jgi:hypothetical protein
LGVDTSQTPTSTLSQVDAVLNNTIRALNANFATPAGIQVNMWQLLNWVFVVQYWSLLYDFGQVQPTLYRKTSSIPTDFTANEYTDVNNIFVNGTLFEIFGSYFQQIIIPLLNVLAVDGTSLGDGRLYRFESLNSTNHLQPRNVTFNLAYSCTEEQLKKPLSLVISVIVADYTFINPVFGFIVLFGAWYERKKYKNRKPDDCNSNLCYSLTAANWCEGCVEKEYEKRNGTYEGSRFLSQVD